MEKSQIKVIITGVTGMVGEGVLHECLLSPFIQEVLIIGRRPCGIQHAKIKELKSDMKKAASQLNFEEAARIRDEIKQLTEWRLMV